MSEEVCLLPCGYEISIKSIASKHTCLPVKLLVPLIVTFWLHSPLLQFATMSFNLLTNLGRFFGICFLHQFIHNCETRFLQLFASGYAFLILCPSLIHKGLKLCLVEQGLICLQWRQQFRLCMQLQNTTCSCSRRSTCVVMEPVEDTLVDTARQSFPYEYNFSKLTFSQNFFFFATAMSRFPFASSSSFSSGGSVGNCCCHSLCVSGKKSVEVIFFC